MEVEVEKLIYLYIAICTALIGYNFVCIFLFRMYRHYVEKKSKQLEQKFISDDADRLKILEKYEPSENNLLSLEKMIDELKEMDPIAAENACNQVRDLFSQFIDNKKIADPIILAYIMKLSVKYGLFVGNADKIFTDRIVRLAGSRNFYLREAALNLLNSIGDEDALIDALRIIDHEKIDHNDKLLHDGMLGFSGNKEELWEKIWEQFDDFSPQFQTMFIQYFRLVTDKYRDKVLALLSDKRINREVHFACLRYLTKYPYDNALPVIIDIVKNRDKNIWEYAAIAASALASYPCGETRKILKELLSDKEWHVRSNAAASLLKLGDENGEFDEILDGDDRYAREALQYALDRQSIAEGGQKQ